VDTAPLIVGVAEGAGTVEGDDAMVEDGQEKQPVPKPTKPVGRPPKDEEYIWQWKPELETSRKTFFL